MYMGGKSDADDKKLKRLLFYIKGTINKRRVIGASSLQDLYTWVYAAYKVHNDMRSHTGVAMTMGWGEMNINPSKKNLNTKSWT